MTTEKETIKPQLMKAVLTVKEKQVLTPHYIRIILEGEDLGIYAQANEGDNNKILIPLDKSAKLTLPDGPVKGGDAKLAMRTYTMRSLDLEKGEMAIDFVMHGETGPASTWAIHAEKGDELGVLMKVKTKPLFQSAAYYFIMGDHTALPVISVMLEKLPKDASGDVLIEVYSEDDVLDLVKPANVNVKWVCNNAPGDTSMLLPEFKRYDITKETDKFVFAAAEFNVIKEIQEVLRADDTLERKNWYAFSYWKHGVAEDASANDRRGLRNA
ncbi:siderophore-interacting protein [Neptunitalea lumnitzerae]|uniref:Siderophore-interacting protein n=1 Tax=Neptunitalea lumnitzerae TaxID=2965509 RepID=A0ABQ5MH94_9FLAO|nr:siderophore-interacting protein [Neptunitalea sp. Y10]GLB48759.1 siderophore-interacting protein [Neptunitalea sp. Y10]